MTIIPYEDLKIEADYKPRGGQYVGTQPHTIKVTHIPSGTVAMVEVGAGWIRNQYKARAAAIRMIEQFLTEPK